MVQLYVYIIHVYILNGFKTRGTDLSDFEKGSLLGYGWHELQSLNCLGCMDG